MKQKLIDEQWVDIIQPSIAQGSDMFGWLFAIGLIIIAAAGFYFLYYRRPRQQLTRCIRALNQAVVTSHDQKLILSQLEYRLCSYLGIATLAQRNRLNRDWQTLLGSLLHYRYQTQQPTASQTRQVLQQCLQLLVTKHPRHAE